MKYTNYFSLVIKEKGIPQLSPRYFRDMMNIVYLEGIQCGFDKIKKSLKGTDEFNKYCVMEFKNNEKLAELTYNAKPEVVMELMLKYSLDDNED